MTAVSEAAAHAAALQVAEAELAGDDWPPDAQRYLPRRGRWIPVHDLPDITDYQPTA